MVPDIDQVMLLTIGQLSKTTGAPKAYVQECLLDPAFARINRPGKGTLIPLWKAVQYWETKSENWYKP